MPIYVVAERLNYKRQPNFLNPINAGFGDPYAANVILYLKGDGENNSTSIVDEKSSALTVYGNTKLSSTQKKYGATSIYFDGSGDYITTPLSSENRVSGSAFTMEGWVYILNAVGADIVLISSTPSVNFVGILLARNPSGNLSMASGGGSVQISSTLALPSNQWNHVALSRNGTSYYLSVNGTVQSFTNATSWSDSSATVWAIGSNARWDFPFYLNGYLDSPRITKGIARYTANFNPETDTYLAY